MFWERFHELCRKSGTSPNSIAMELDVSSGVITRWRSGGIPNGNMLIKIADYFNCSLDYLLGRDEYVNTGVKVTTTDLSNDKRRLLEYYDQLSDMEKGEILGELKVMARERAEAKNAKAV